MSKMTGRDWALMPKARELVNKVAEMSAPLGFSDAFDILAAIDGDRDLYSLITTHGALLPRRDEWAEKWAELRKRFNPALEASLRDTPSLANNRALGEYVFNVCHGDGTAPVDQRVMYAIFEWKKWPTAIRNVPAAASEYNVLCRANGVQPEATA